MNPTIKKFILFTVGAVSLTKEKFDEFVGQLEKEGALNKNEGEQLVKDFIQESDKRTREFSAAVDKEVRRVMAEMNTKHAEHTHEHGDMHKCEDCGKDCDCTDMENCKCDDDCNCQDCNKSVQTESN